MNSMRDPRVLVIDDGVERTLMDAALAKSAYGDDACHAELAAALARGLQRSDNILALFERRPDNALLVRSANGEFCSALGLRLQDLVGRPLASFCAEESIAALTTASAAVGRGEAARTDLKCLHSGGGWRWLGLNLMPCDMRGPAVTGCVALGRDITKPHEERRQERAAESLLAQVFISADVPVAITSDNGLFLMTNPAYDQAFGVAPGAMIGRMLREFIAERDRETVAAVNRKPPPGGLQLDICMMRSDGSELAVSMTQTVPRGREQQGYRIVTLRPKPKLADLVSELSGMSVRIAGKIRLIGLEEVRSALGPRWRQLADRVVAQAEQVIERRIGPHDTFLKVEDSSFVICFSDLAEHEASLKAAAIGREIRERLLGAGEPEAAVQVVTTVSPMSMAEPVQPRSAGPAALKPEWMARIREGQAGPVAPPAAPVITIDLVRGRSETLIGAVVCGRSPAVRNEAAGFYPEHVCDLTALMTAADYIEAAGRGLPSVVFLNVGLATLQVRSAYETYSAAYRGVASLLQERAIFLVEGLQSGSPHALLMNVNQKLRAFGRGVGYHVAADSIPSLEFAGASKPFVAVSGVQWRGADTTVKLKLKRSLRELQAQRCRPLVLDVPSSAWANTALQYGAELTALRADRRSETA